LLTRQRLLKVKARALRQGFWLKALSRMERGVFDLTVRCVERVRSSVLAGMVSGIIAKLLKSLKPGFLETAMRVGCAIAAEICDLALEWGNAGAYFWRHDPGFTRFLGVSAVNEGRFEAYEGERR
jgi:hypothetical protein